VETKGLSPLRACPAWQRFNQPSHRPTRPTQPNSTPRKRASARRPTSTRSKPSIWKNYHLIPKGSLQSHL